jgi:hypothetical protein
MISKKLISENGFNEDHPKSFFLRLKKAKKLILVKNCNVKSTNLNPSE